MTPAIPLSAKIILLAVAVLAVMISDADVRRARRGVARRLAGVGAKLRAKLDAHRVIGIGFLVAACLLLLR